MVLRIGDSGDRRISAEEGVRNNGYMEDGKVLKSDERLKFEFSGKKKGKNVGTSASKGTSFDRL